jgi:hypothetical protein
MKSMQANQSNIIENTGGQNSPEGTPVWSNS